MKKKTRARPKHAMSRRSTKSVASTLSLTTLAKRISEEHKAAEACGWNYLEHARRAGEFLAQAKDQLKPGDSWTVWVQANVPNVQLRMVQIYMYIAENWGTIKEKRNENSLSTISEALAEIRAERKAQAAITGNTVAVARPMREVEVSVRTEPIAIQPHIASESTETIRIPIIEQSDGVIRIRPASDGVATPDDESIDDSAAGTPGAPEPAHDVETMRAHIIETEPMFAQRQESIDARLARAVALRAEAERAFKEVFDLQEELNHDVDEFLSRASAPVTVQ